MPYPLVPKRLPDGTVVWEEKGKALDVMRALRMYDERLTLVRNFALGQWEAWRHNEDQSDSRVGIWTGDLLPEPAQVVGHIAEHDTRRGYDPLAAHDARDKARQKGVNDQLETMALENADRMHYELVDEFSAHAPAARPMPLGPKGHRRRVSR